MLKSIIQHRRGTTAEWIVSTIIPKDGELVVEECAGGLRKFKFGDGVSLFKDLPYATSGVDGLIYVDNLLQLTANGVPVGNKIEITGGSGSVTKVKLTNLLKSLTFDAAANVPTYLKFSFTSVLDDEETGDCICTLAVGEGDKAESVYYATIQQGENEIEISKYLKVGANTLTLTCTDSYGNSRYLTYVVAAVDLKIRKDASFDDTQVFDDNIDFSYIPVGAGISKTIHFLIDGKEIKKIEKVTTNGRQAYYEIPKEKLHHGCNILEVYSTATINGVEIKSNTISYELLFAVANREDAMLSSVYDGVTELTQGDLVQIPYTVYDPTKLVPEVDFEISYINEDGKKDVYSTVTWDVSRGAKEWETRTYPAGEVFFTIRYTYDLYGETTTISKTHKFIVAALSVDVEPVKDKLQLFLTAAGRSNQAKDKDEWKYGDVTTTFTGFNWSSNGWVTDANGDQCLRLNGDARATINMLPFTEDFKKAGKTIEFEYAVRDVNSRDAVVIDCYANSRGFRATADKAFLESSGTLIKCNYKDGERIRVTVTVDKLTTAKIKDEESGVLKEIRYGFVSIYVNGILSGCQVYTENDSFSQSPGVAISLGSQFCGLDLYAVRIYQKALSIPDVLNNYISDIADPVKKVAIYSDNDLLYLPSDFPDDFTELDDFVDNISYEKVIKQGKIPVVTFTGPMPTFKGDKKKKTTRMKFEHPAHPELNFDLLMDQIDVQGTSSQYYVRKNWKVKLPEKRVHIPGQIPAKVFCLKVDYAEATGTHNTGAAMYIETLYDRDKATIPAQIVEKDEEGNVIRGDEAVRTTIAGFPVLIFEKETEDSVPVFASKGNFNYDKGAEDTFGFTEDYDVECWEFCNNTSNAVNFLSTVPVDWSEDFEPRYVPESAKWDDIEKLLEARSDAGKGIGTWDENGLNQGVKLRNLMTNCVKNFAELVEWVNSTATYEIVNGARVDITPTKLETPVTYEGITYENDDKAYRLAKFKAEFEDHFNMHYTALYYVFTFFALMVDQRAKNLFLTRWRDGTAEDGSPIYHWYPYFYDNDTIFGINNEGALVFDYYHEDTDQLGSANVYNGQNSILWNNFRECFAAEIKATYAALRTKDAQGNIKLSYDAIIDQFVTNGSEKYAPIVYNEDADYKYMSMARPNEEGVVDTSNLYQVRGPGDNHLKYFVDNRIKYCDSKWFAGDYPANYIFMRIYTPTLAVINDTDSEAVKAEKLARNEKIQKSLAAVPANSAISIKPYSLMYAGVRYGANGNILQARLQSHNEFHTFSAPLQEDGKENIFNDTETAIYGASEISSLGDLSGLYCGVISLGAASKLVELKIGDENKDYYNDNFREISVGSNRLLKKIDLRNCFGLGIAGDNPQKTLALENCPNIEEIYAEGTNLETITLPSSGYVRTLHLPNSTTTINIKNQLYIEKFKLDTFENVRQLCIDNCPTLDTAAMLNRCKDENGNWTVERVRLTDLNWSFDDVTFVNSLFSLKGLDENNFEQDDAYLEGTCFIKKLSGNEYATIKSHYPHLEITFEELDSQIIFMSADGKTELYRETIYNGASMKRDPVMSGKIKVTPTRESTAKYHYHYAGWTRLFDPIDTEDPDRSNPPQANALVEILGDRILYPAFENELRSYDVEFYNPSRTGNVHLQTVKTYYGSAATYTLSEPTKLDVVNAGDYQFTGWYPPIDCITGPHKCYAQYTLLDSAWYIIKPEDVYCEILDDKSVRISAYNNTSKAIIRIPETFTIEGKTYNITEIGSSCFQSSSIEYVKLPETVTTICDWAFNNCQKLMTLELPESLRVIGSRAFTQCSLLESIRIPRNVRSIAPQSFCESASLTTIEVEPGNEYYHVTDGCLIETQTKVLLASVPTAVIPDDGTVTTIAEYAFASSMIESITIPDTITSIGSNAFSSCLNITEVAIPDGCIISSTAFAWCPNLSRVTLPIDLEYIWTYAFHQCPIEHLIIPRRVKEISDHAFADNSSLKTLDFWNIDGTKVDPQAFLNSGHEDGLTINVPWQEGAIAYIPWGANNATINYKVAPPEIDED